MTNFDFTSMQQIRDVESLNIYAFAKRLHIPAFYRWSMIKRTSRDNSRTPMQWSGDRNAGFSRANPQRLYLPVIIDPEYHYEAINVETQQNNPHSLLWWMKRAIAQRREFPAFGRGSMELLYPDNRRVLAFVRSWKDEHVLVVANLSRFAQSTEIDLSRFQGLLPVEMFGRADFPPITDRPWQVAMGAHAFYWFRLSQGLLAKR
jgi:maltose alpha-D-glucosyltransferase/alpha-amylase